jgi:hypothetical protein
MNIVLCESAAKTVGKAGLGVIDSREITPSNAFKRLLTPCVSFGAGLRACANFTHPTSPRFRLAVAKPLEVLG